MYEGLEVYVGWGSHHRCSPKCVRVCRSSSSAPAATSLASIKTMDVECWICSDMLLQIK